MVRAAWGATREGAPLPPGPLVVVANHDSLLDPFVLGAALERPLRFVAKEELWANRLVGRILDGLGGIPLRRGRGAPFSRCRTPPAWPAPPATAEAGRVVRR